MSAETEFPISYLDWLSGEEFVEGIGFPGKIVLGDSLEEVEERIGSGLIDPDLADRTLYAGPWVLALRGTESVEGISLLGDGAPELASGVRLGDSLAQVVECYGEAKRQEVRSGRFRVAYPLLGVEVLLDEGVVEAVTVRAPKEALARGELSPNGKRRVYRTLCNMAGCEGEIPAKEREVLEHYRARFEIPSVEATEIEAQALKGEGIKVGKLKAERSVLMKGLIAVAAADGVLSKPERKRLTTFAKAVGLAPEKLEAELDRQIPSSESAAPLPSPTTSEPEVPLEVRSLFGGLTPALGHLVLLGAVGADFVQVDTFGLEPQGGFRGFALVPQGKHRLVIKEGDFKLERWLDFAPGEVHVLRYEGRELSPADPEASERYVQLASSGAMSLALVLYPVTLRGHWHELTRFIPPGPLSSPRTEEDPPGESRLERALLGTHGGDAESFLGELSASFLQGYLAGGEDAWARYVHLLQASYHCGESLPQDHVELFVQLVQLLIEQHTELPDAFFGADSAVAFGSGYLAEDLVDTEVPELVKAGRSFAAFRAERHA